MSSLDRTLSDADVEAVVAALAPKVVELLRAAPAAAAVDAESEALWSPADVARELGMSAEWVRDHRVELGVISTSGVRPRLWFDPAAVRAWATARDAVVRSETRDPAPALGAKRARSRRAGAGADLLPIGGATSAPIGEEVPSAPKGAHGERVRRSAQAYGEEAA